MSFQVELDHDKCIGCMACTRCDNFKCGEDFKAYAVIKAIDHIGCVLQAAEGCPVGAISVSSGKGETRE